MADALPARLLALVALLTFAIPVHAQQPAGPVDPAEANAGSDAPPLRIGPVTLSGSLHADALKVNGDEADEYRDEFRLRRARVGLAGNLTPKIGWNVSAEFTATPVLRNAFILVRLSPYANVRAGQATPQTSIERGTSPTALEFIDRTRLTSQLTYPQDIGVSVFSERPLAGWLSYAAGVVNGAGFNRADDNDAKDLFGRIEIVTQRLPHTNIVLSGGTGEQPAGRRSRSSAGIQYDGPRAKVLVEALREHTTGLATREGFLVSGVYRIHARQVRPHFRMMEVVARFVTFDDPLAARGLPGNVDDEGGGALSTFIPAVTHEWQVGGNYYATRNVRLMGNVIIPADDRTTPGATLVSRLQVVF